MAIGITSIVAPKAFSIAQPPMMGIVDSGAGPWDVLWSDGKLVDGIAATSLDEILAADAPALAKVGSRVQVQDSTNWGYGVAIAAYKRNGSDKLLVQNPAGYFTEALASQCTVVP